MSVLSSLSQELTLSNSALTALVFSHKWVRMKLNMNERHVRREELPLLKSKCHCSTTPSGKDWVEPPRKVEKWSPTTRRQAALEHSCWVQSHQGENHFSFRLNILSAQTRTVCFFFFFLLKRVCFSVKFHKHRLSLCLSSRHKCFLH